MIEILLSFARFGSLGFGGPIAVIAMMEEEWVRRKKWVSSRQFNEFYAICKLLPGPVSTQMAISLGAARGGVRGGLIAGTAFILPSFLMLLALSVLYTSLGNIGAYAPILTAMQAAGLAVIATSTWNLFKPEAHHRIAWMIAAVSATIVALFPRWEPVVIVLWGLIGGWIASSKPTPPISHEGTSENPKKMYALGALFASAGFSTPVSQLFWICFKAAFLVFGTGLAVIPLLENDIVRQHGWLTHSQFMDGLVLGQVTPGPIVITATFLGYKVAGLAGACSATAGMFIPSFINVLILVPRIWRKFQGTQAAAGFTSFAIPAVVGGIVATTVNLAIRSLSPTHSGLGWFPVFAFVLALGLASGKLLRKKTPAWLLILGCGVLGLIYKLIF